MAEAGVVFPPGGEAGRTSAVGRAVVAAALREIDPIGARAAEQQTNWRREYLPHFRRLVEAGIDSGAAARRSAGAGLAALHDRMRYRRPDGSQVALRDVFADEPAGSARLGTAVCTGEGPLDRELSLPYRGERLRGDGVTRRLDAWVAAGVVEPSCATAVAQVLANPDWLDLRDLRVVALGAGAEMGPVRSLLRWGADVVAIDLPRPPLWSRLFEVARRSAGRLQFPTRPGSSGAGVSAQHAGVDLLGQLPAVAQWLLDIPGRVVLGNYVYADGADNVRVSVAVDALGAHLRALRPETALAFLATPTDVFAVPAEAVAQADRNYRSGALGRWLRRPLRLVSGGRLLRRNYPPGADPGICDSLVAQQGPNYALAKRLQRWRAAVDRADGATVSFAVAPPTRTRSVVRNRALAAAYAGAHVFGVEVFEPATSNTLMAALLVHQLRHPPPPLPQVWQEEAYAAAHGGLWRAPYAPRSALGLAAVIGIGGARG